MNIGLAPYAFVNGDVAHNLAQIDRALRACPEPVDLLCFGETFLQGFDALCWDYRRDRDVAAPRDSEAMAAVANLARAYRTAILLGYVERDGDRLYSSCALVTGAGVAQNYQRITPGWKEASRTDDHYAEGSDARPFEFMGRRFSVALCGDLWEHPESFRSDNFLIWPVYVNFTIEEWRQELPEYAGQAALASPRTLMVNAISRDPDSHGGAFLFRNGTVAQAMDFDREAVLVVRDL